MRRVHRCVEIILGEFHVSSEWTIPLGARKRLTPNKTTVFCITSLSRPTQGAVLCLIIPTPVPPLCSIRKQTNMDR